jgi:hypothetical protein
MGCFLIQERVLVKGSERQRSQCTLSFPHDR